MVSTSVNLLNRLKDSSSDADWYKFVELYAPLLFHWARRRGIEIDECVDLVQDVLVTVVRELHSFEYNPAKSFRGWLRTIVIRRTIDLQRKNQLRRAESLDATQALQVIAPETELYDETEYRRLLVYRALQVLQESESGTVFQAGWLQLVEGVRAPEVAARLNMTLNSVYLAKSRLLKRLREELDGMLD